MLRRTSLPLLVALPLAFVLGSCQADPTIPRIRDELLLRLTVSKASIRAGQPDTIVATVTNNFGERVSIRFPNACQVFAYIRDERGRVVTPGRGWNCLPVVSTLTLDPDASRSYIFVWTGLSEFAGELEPSLLAPGDYFATATLQAGDFIVHAPPVRIILAP